MRLSDKHRRWIEDRPRLFRFACFLYRNGIAYLPQKSPHQFMLEYWRFLRNYQRYRRMPGAEKIDVLDLWPCLYDKMPITPVEPSQFYQDSWAAGKIFEARPEFHVDVGSNAYLVGILAQFTRLCSVDIRPLAVKLGNLECKKGSLLALPFPNRSLQSISSLSVLEHIGLGRYGDDLDPQGTDKAVAELLRVLGPGGNIYVSVPIDRNTVYFNAHRTFSLDCFVAKFGELKLVEGRLIYKNDFYSLEEGMRLIVANQPLIGLFHFKMAR